MYVRAVRILGILLFLLGCGGTAYATRAMFNSHRPRDLLFAVCAPLAAIIALVGLLLAFVPSFFSG